MKKFLFLTLTFIICFSSCDKKDDTKPYTGTPVIFFKLKPDNPDHYGYFASMNQDTKRDFDNAEGYFIFKTSDQKSTTVYSFEVTSIDINKGIGSLDVSFPKDVVFSNIEYINGTGSAVSISGASKILSMKASGANKPLTIKGTFTIPTPPYVPNQPIISTADIMVYSSIYGYQKEYNYYYLPSQVQRSLTSNQDWGMNYY